LSYDFNLAYKNWKGLSEYVEINKKFNSYVIFTLFTNSTYFTRSIGLMHQSA
jgi:hypothetical protein